MVARARRKTLSLSTELRLERMNIDLCPLVELASVYRYDGSQQARAHAWHRWVAFSAAGYGVRTRSGAQSCRVARLVEIPKSQLRQGRSCL